MTTEKERKPRWFKFWEKGNKEQVEAINRLAEGLYGLQKAREEGNKQINEMLTNPEQFASLIQGAISRIYPPQVTAIPPTRVAMGPGLVSETHLLASPEAVKETIDTVTKAVLEKMEEMEKHVTEAVSELPPDTLEKIAEKIKAGEDFTLRRRHGCVHIDFGYGDDEYYLRL